MTGALGHWLIAPVLLPAVVGALIILWMRGDLLLQRVFSVAATAAQVALAVWLLAQAAGGEIFVYRLGNWQVPFGIALVLDRLAGMMLLLTAVLALVVQLYAIGSGWDRRGAHFHALFQFQLMGLTGAFLTGDAFNLFVFFEVLLIASYGLLAHGGGEMRLRASVQYVVVNLAGSALFLAALGTIYASMGTLNMVDLADRMTRLPPDQTALIRVGAVLLMLVFAIKAALVPLHFWLPATYANAPGPVAALFAIMTKVGLYGIIRFYTLVFPTGEAMGTLVADLLLPAALLTLVLGQLGVMGSRDLGRMAAWGALASVGTLTLAVAQFTEAGISAGLWYLLHSTLATAALFLVADLVAGRRGSLRLAAMSRGAQAGLVGAFYMAAAVGVAGLPPLSGFLGKLAVLQATRGTDWTLAIWAAILVTSLMAIIGLARAGTIVFWTASDAAAATAPEPGPAPWLALACTGALIAGLVALTVAAGPVMRFTDATAAQLHDLGPYVDAVLVRQEGAR